MAIVYTTKVDAVRVTTQGSLTDVVKEIDYTMTGAESGCTFALPGTKKLGAADEDAFTAYEDLTEAQLVDWVESDEAALEPVKGHIAYVLAKEVEKAALEQKPLPWAPEPPVSPTP